MTEDLDGRIAAIQKEIKTTPCHKATEHHLGRLKARLAKLKDEKVREASKKGAGGAGFGVKKAGDATVVLVGPPSVGKSTLINKLTKAVSKVGPYAFTTTTVIPGMMQYNGANIQIFDVPGLIAGAAEGKGRGKEVISQVRPADLILLMTDQEHLSVINNLKKELDQAGIRLDQEPPAVLIHKKQKGGIKILSVVKQSLAKETIEKIAGEFRLGNAEIVIREDITIERLIDALAGSRQYLPYFIVVNKIDKLSLKKLEELKKEFAGQKTVFISCLKNIGLEDLKRTVWDELGLIRVYLKKKRQEPDLRSPFILRKKKSLRDLLKRISICEKEEFRAAKIYGPGAKYPGQEVSLGFVPSDKEIVMFV